MKFCHFGNENDRPKPQTRWAHVTLRSANAYAVCIVGRHSKIIGGAKPIQCEVNSITLRRDLAVQLKCIMHCGQGRIQEFATGGPGLKLSGGRGFDPPLSFQPPYSLLYFNYHDSRALLTLSVIF